MRKVRFSGFPPRLRDEASLRTVFGTFGRVVSLHISSSGKDQVSGTCRFSDAEEAALTCSAMKGLKIGPYTIQVEKEENEADDPKRREEKKRKKEEKRKKEGSELGASSSSAKLEMKEKERPAKPAESTLTTSSQVSDVSGSTAKKRNDVADSEVVLKKKKLKLASDADDGTKLPSASTKLPPSENKALKKPLTSSSDALSVLPDLKRQSSESSEISKKAIKKNEIGLPNLKRSVSSTTVNTAASNKPKSTQSLTSKIDVGTAKELAKKEIKDLLKEKKKPSTAEESLKKPASLSETVHKPKNGTSDIKESSSKGLKETELQKKQETKSKTSSENDVKKAVTSYPEQPTVEKWSNETKEMKRQSSMNNGILNKKTDEVINPARNNFPAKPAPSVSAKEMTKAGDIVKPKANSLSVTDKSVSKASVMEPNDKVEPTSNGSRPQPSTDASKESRTFPDSAPVEKKPVSVWEEYLDERYGVPYYFNPATNETTWEVPPAGSRIVKVSDAPAVATSAGATEQPSAATNSSATTSQKPAEEQVSKSSAIAPLAGEEKQQQSDFVEMNPTPTSSAIKPSLMLESRKSDTAMTSTVNPKVATGPENVQRAPTISFSGSATSTGSAISTPAVASAIVPIPPAARLSEPSPPLGSGITRKSLEPSSPSSGTSAVQPTSPTWVPAMAEENKGSTVSGVVAHLRVHYGFIRCDISPVIPVNYDMFFHFDELTPGYQQPKLGDEVEFEIGFNFNRKQPFATNVRRVLSRGPNQLPASAPPTVSLGGVAVAPPAASHRAANLSAPVPIKRETSVGLATQSLQASSSRRYGRSRERASSRDIPRTSRSGRRSRSPPHHGDQLRRQHSSPAVPPTSGRWTQSSAAVGGSRRRDLQWVRYNDPVSGLPYWHCPSTKETTWTNPYQ